MEIYDTLIIGGGPGGSCTASYLARAGKRVLLLEKEHFPRFHIGESLLPYNFEIFRELDLIPSLEAEGFIRKFGAQFHLGNGTKGTGFVFSDGKFNRESEAIQVERSRFDHVLLKHARASGADVREGWTVAKFKNLGRTIALEARDPDGKPHTFEASFLVDASGRGNVTGNQENLRVVHPRLKKLAVFGHFLGVKLDAGKTSGDTLIVRLHNKWFWIIPVSKEKVSVGCVMDRDEFAQSKLPPAELFNQLWQSTPFMRERMKDTELVGEIRTASDFSYRNRRFVGPRLLRVGDAAAFMDPIFSAGVFIAMFSGKIASQVVLQSLAAGDDGGPRLRTYEKRVRKAMEFYWEMVEHYYTKPFMEIFLEPREKFSLASTVNAVLAGDLEGGWYLRWRLRVFFWLIRLQARWPLVPRIFLD